MQPKKMIGLALGDRSLLAAEIGGAEQLAVKKLAEFIFPAGVSLDQPALLGKALAEFLRDQQFTAKAAVIGLPAKWLLVKTKEAPPADAATLADVLRLQAEGDFSTELKDLVYDYAGDADPAKSSSVLLMATQRSHVDAAAAMCAAANVSPIAITATAVALGEATGRRMTSDALILAVGETGAELTSQSGAMPLAVRHLRGGVDERSLIGELRRAVTSIPGKPAREIILFDADRLDAKSLGQQMGVVVRGGDVRTLGVEPGIASNGDARKYAAAVSLAMAGIWPQKPAIDFLHSRLAPRRQNRIPRWAMISTVAAIVLLAIGIFAYVDLQRQQADVAAMTARVAAMQGDIKSADAFVTMVSFAQGWHSGDPRYLACLRDITAAFPEDGQTYAVSLIIRETTRTATGGKAVETGVLAGQLYGKTSDQQRVQMVLDQLKRSPAFADAKLGGTQDAGRGREVSFSITFNYRPPA